MKKIVILVILIAVMFVTISYATALDTKENDEKKESPLYKIRTNNAIRRSIQNIKTKFFGERIFFIPFLTLKNKNNLRERIENKYTDAYTECGPMTVGCRPTDCPTCHGDCTSQATMACGSCTEGRICKTIYGKC